MQYVIFYLFVLTDCVKLANIIVQGISGTGSPEIAYAYMRMTMIMTSYL